MQELSSNSNKNREELSIMPHNKEFVEELSEDNKYKLEKDGTLFLKNKLVMKEGEHNGVHYSWEQLKEKYLTGEGAGLFFDHEDSVKNYVGLVKNLKLNEATKEIFGDIHVTNKQSALDISLGAKWGVSPTIDAEKILKDGKSFAMDPDFLSYSLVLRPAVRETMLNSLDGVDNATKEDKKVEKQERELQMLAERDAKIQKLEDDNATMKEKSDEQDKKIEEQGKKIDESEKKEVEKESEDLCALECSIGFTSEADKNSRLEELKSLSAESRSNLKSAHEKYASILKLGEDEDKDDEDDDEKKKKEDLASNAKKLPVSSDPQVRMRSELASESARQAKVNSNILAYMKEQHRK